MAIDPKHIAANQRSWNVATANHNRHKGDQAAWLRNGGNTLFPEELELLGDPRGRDLVHLQCNAGQDTLCLARRGARVTGVDLSDHAIAFARDLSDQTGIPASFVQSEVVAWTHETDQRFDIAFASYGVLGWNEDLAAWMAGAHRVLRPGGMLVMIEYHPLTWSLGPTLGLDGDDYFERGPYLDPVGDYTAESMEQLGAPGPESRHPNPEPATSWQYTLAQTVMAILGAGFTLEHLQEYPFSNGCRSNEQLVLGEGRRWYLPAGRTRLPLMFGFRARA